MNAAKEWLATNARPDVLAPLILDWIEMGILNEPDPIVIAAEMAKGATLEDARVKAILANPFTHKDQGLAP